MADDFSGLGLVAAARAIREGRTSSRELVDACLERIGKHDGVIGAWAHLDADHARRQAADADQRRGAGQDTGPLHGVPVGIKDIFDTEMLPTENGSPLHAGRRPREDAACVAMLRQAGAVILGKTVTTEFATYEPAGTTNPHNREHTPGGSSSGSAAAVAAFMVPGALGSQTNGSIIRPASYCGVYGYKPSHGLISRHGMLNTSRALDHAGVFARSLADVAALAEPLMAHDARDPDMRALAAPGLVRMLESPVPHDPYFAFVRTPAWDKAGEDVAGGLAELMEAIGKKASWVDMPHAAASLYDWHRTIMAADIAVNLDREYRQGAERMGKVLRDIIESGRTITAYDYKRAIAGAATLRVMVDEIFGEADAIITPAATGEAPRGLDSTGDPVFATPWSLLGLPAISLPLLSGSNGLPVGVQIVGRLREDARLFRTARWLVEKVEAVTGAQGGSS